MVEQPVFNSSELPVLEEHRGLFERLRTQLTLVGAENILGESYDGALRIFAKLDTDQSAWDKITDLHLNAEPNEPFFAIYPWDPRNKNLPLEKFLEERHMSDKMKTTIKEMNLEEELAPVA